ncbi:MAG: ABC transporter substrate-binding protein, partial [Anaerolineales bacterium]|nr:ABC transporter substrate-binding protein [Anaerolineales bacterium]
AIVYKAYDTRLESDVAVKVIRIERLAPEILQRAMKRFEREAKSLAQLTHPNLVKVLDFGEYEGQPYLVMPYLPGGTLKQKMRGQPMHWQEAARLLIPIARALDYAHKRGLIHRDVKPSNILITESGEPMLTDFGVAKIIDEEATVDLTGTSAAVGTPEYMAPEQATSKNIDHRADIYALGIVFYEMVTGRRPFQADTPLAVLFKHASESLPRPTQFVSNLPESVEKILLKALAKKPEDRYQNAGEMAQAMESQFSGVVPVAKPRLDPGKPQDSRIREKTRNTLATIDQTDTMSTVDEDATVDDKPIVGARKTVTKILEKPNQGRIVRYWPVGVGGILIVCILFVTSIMPFAQKLSNDGPIPTVHLTGVPNKAPAPYECKDALGCVKIAPDELLHIAYWGVLSGADGTLGEDSKRGVEIAIDDKDGKLLGHDILLTTEDAGCTPDGGATAAAKLAADTSLVGLIGSSCSDETVGGIAAITNAGLTTISPSNTRPALTYPSRGSDYAGYLRTTHSDALQGKAVAEFAYNVLGARKAATIHDGSAYAEALQQVFADNFTALGGQIVAQEAVAKDTTDMRPVLTSIAADGPEFLYYPVFVTEGGFITAQVREIAGLETVALAGSDGIFTPDFVKAAGPNVEGMYLSCPDFSLFPDGYAAFIEKHNAKYGGAPLSIFHAHAYDATNILFAALEQVAVVEADGTVYVPKQALRDAIYATKDFKGITGTLSCSASGDCGAPVIAVYQVVNADPASWNPQDATNPNPKKVYP